MSKRSVRAGGTDLNITNSGHEVWLYDEANREAIRNAGPPDEGFGGMPPRFEESTSKGLIVGYSLVQDDDVHVYVLAGNPLSEAELAVGHWLEPQIAFLQLPSGKLCVESNDVNRIGPEPGTGEGGEVNVAPGDYRLTLYRIDHEALEREGMEWDGPQEVVVLTPGGSLSDAASFLLPYELRRDLDWVGKYSVHGKTADALVWFGDMWDTFVLNLDANALQKLGVKPGAYLQTRSPDTGLTLVSTYADSWADAKKLPLPEGIDANEHGFTALFNLQDWKGAQALYCRRDTSKKRVEDRHLNIWLPAIVEVLDAKPRVVGAAQRSFAAAELRQKEYFSSTFLSLILSEVLPGVGDLNELLLPDAIDRMDAAFRELELAPFKDLTWTETYDRQPAETTARLYGGSKDSLGVFMCAQSNVAVFFISERQDERWILTGCADDVERWIRLASERRPGGIKVEVQSLDEDLASIYSAHRETLDEADDDVIPLVASHEPVETLFGRFLSAAFD